MKTHKTNLRELRNERHAEDKKLLELKTQLERKIAAPEQPSLFAHPNAA